MPEHDDEPITPREHRAGWWLPRVMSIERLPSELASGIVQLGLWKCYVRGCRLTPRARVVGADDVPLLACYAHTKQMCREQGMPEPAFTEDFGR